jgi:hypothetical protein
VQLQAADLYLLGISCIKLAAATSTSTEAADRKQAAWLLTWSWRLAEAIQKQHANAQSAAAAAVATAPVEGSTSSTKRKSQQVSSASLTTNSSSSSGSGPVLAVLLLGRILHRLGQAFVSAGSNTPLAPSSKQAADSAADAPAAEQQSTEASGCDVASSWTQVLMVGAIGLRDLVEKLLPSLQLPGAPGSEEACSAARQQLQQQCAQLQQQLASLSNRLWEAGVSWSSQFYLSSSSDAPAVLLPQELAAAVLGFGQQLVQFSEALCAQLPVPLCCNNPGCEKSSGASEQLLVAGKGSVCSRCK